MLTAWSESRAGPSVWHPQMAHLYPERWAMIFFVRGLKSSRLLGASGGITLRRQMVLPQPTPAAFERQPAKFGSNGRFLGSGHTIAARNPRRHSWPVPVWRTPMPHATGGARMLEGRREGR